MAAEDPLSNDVLHLIVEGQHAQQQKEKKLEKTVPVQNVRTNPAVSPTIRGMDENMAKIVARRSQGVTITEDDLFMGQEVAIDFGPEPNEDGIPGAYSGGPGADYGRIEKTPLPQHLLGDATKKTQQEEKDESDSDHPSNASQEWTFRQVDQAESGRSTERKRHRILFVSIGILLLLLAIILPTVLLIGDKEKPKQNLGQDMTTQAPSAENILVPNLTQYTLDALEDPESYQWWAYGWVEKDPLWESFEPWRKQQRFAMACLFFALERLEYLGWAGESADWIWWDECVWKISSNIESGGCDDSGRIRTLDLSLAPRLEGSLPREVAFLTRLNTIDFSSAKTNQGLDTLLPLNVTNVLPALKTLNLSDCALSGRIPSTLGLLTTLTKLDLSMNDLTSAIPSELALLSQLSVLVLSKNNLSGTIPTEVRAMSSLVDFQADNNTNLEGSCTDVHCTIAKGDKPLSECFKC